MKNQHLQPTVFLLVIHFTNDFCGYFKGTNFDIRNPPPDCHLDLLSEKNCVKTEFITEYSRIQEKKFSSVSIVSIANNIKIQFQPV